MEDDWISANEALTRVAAAMDASSAISAICTRAYAGLIEAKAVCFIVNDQASDDALIPKEFWWGEGDGALKENWKAGDFETRINSSPDMNFSPDMKAFGVSFSRSGIEALVAPAQVRGLSETSPPANVGGRPPAAWWDDLWIEIARQLWTGELHPKKQSDIEAAMLKWAIANGHSPAESTIRRRARKLRTALSDEGKK